MSHTDPAVPPSGDPPRRRRDRHTRLAWSLLVSSVVTTTLGVVYVAWYVVADDVPSYTHGVVTGSSLVTLALLLTLLRRVTGRGRADRG